jgi:predicted nucleic acid-binding protein
LTIVSDTSPIAYLLLIGDIEVLPQLFGGVAIPVPEAIERLRQTNFRASPALLRKVLDSALPE